MKYVVLAVSVLYLVYAVLYATKTLDYTLVSVVWDQITIAVFGFIIFYDIKDE